MVKDKKYKILQNKNYSTLLFSFIAQATSY